MAAEASDIEGVSDSSGKPDESTLLRLHPVAAAGVASDAVASDPDSAPASHDGAPEQKDQPIVCASASVASGDESGPSESEASAPREWIDLPATSEAMGRRFYRKKLPDLGDMVIVKVLAIAEMGAYVELLEYGCLEGMILLSELSRRRTRTINKLIRVGATDVCVPVRINKEKGYIDLSKRRVAKQDVAACREKFEKAKAVDSIMRCVAEKHDIPLEDLNTMIAWPLYESYGHAYDAFMSAIHDDPDLVYCNLDDSVPIELWKETVLRVRSTLAVKATTPRAPSIQSATGLNAMRATAGSDTQVPEVSAFEGSSMDDVGAGAGTHAFVESEHGTTATEQEEVSLVQSWLRSDRDAMPTTLDLTGDMRAASPDEWRLLGTLLKSDTVVTELRLRGSNFGVSGTEYMSDGLASNTTLVGLDLFGCGISVEGSRLLASALATNSALCVLDLGGNLLSTAGIEAVCAMLSSNSSLQTLGLRESNLNAEDMVHVAAALRKNTTLQVLNLSRNPIRADGVSHLAPALGVNTTLQELVLSHCDLDGEAAAHLGGALRINRTLQELSVQGNALSAVGADHLVAALCARTELTHVALGAFTRHPFNGIECALSICGVPELTSIPADIGKLPLIELRVTGIPHLHTPPPEVHSADDGRAAARFMRDMWQSGAAPCHWLKVLLVGNAEQGKTSLADVLGVSRSRTDCRSRARDAGAAPHGRAAHDRTEGVAVRVWRPTPDLRASVWDFAGQDVYYATHALYLSSRAVYVLVFTLSDPEYPGKLGPWLESLQARTPGAAAVLVATHLDTVASEAVAARAVQTVWHWIKNTWGAMHARVAAREVAALVIGAAAGTFSEPDVQAARAGIAALRDLGGGCPPGSSRRHVDWATRVRIVGTALTDREQKLQDRVRTRLLQLQEQLVPLTVWSAFAVSNTEGAGIAVAEDGSWESPLDVTSLVESFAAALSQGANSTSEDTADSRSQLGCGAPPGALLTAAVPNRYVALGNWVQDGDVGHVGDEPFLPWAEFVLAATQHARCGFTCRDGCTHTESAVCELVRAAEFADETGILVLLGRTSTGVSADCQVFLDPEWLPAAVARLVNHSMARGPVAVSVAPHMVGKTPLYRLQVSCALSGPAQAVDIASEDDGSSEYVWELPYSVETEVQLRDALRECLTLAADEGEDEAARALSLPRVPDSVSSVQRRTSFLFKREESTHLMVTASAKADAMQSYLRVVCRVPECWASGSTLGEVLGVDVADSAVQDAVSLWVEKGYRLGRHGVLDRQLLDFVWDGDGVGRLPPSEVVRDSLLQLLMLQGLVVPLKQSVDGYSYDSTCDEDISVSRPTGSMWRHAALRPTGAGFLAVPCMCSDDGLARSIPTFVLEAASAADVTTMQRRLWAPVSAFPPGFFHRIAANIAEVLDVQPYDKKYPFARNVVAFEARASGDAKRALRDRFGAGLPYACAVIRRVKTGSIDITVWLEHRSPGSATRAVKKSDLDAALGISECHRVLCAIVGQVELSRRRWFPGLALSLCAVCPLCGATLTRRHTGGFVEFACHHAVYDGDDLGGVLLDDTAMWSAASEAEGVPQRAVGTDTYVSAGPTSEGVEMRVSRAAHADAVSPAAATPDGVEALSLNDRQRLMYLRVGEGLLALAAVLQPAVDDRLRRLFDQLRAEPHGLVCVRRRQHDTFAQRHREAKQALDASRETRDAVATALKREDVSSERKRELEAELAAATDEVRVAGRALSELQEPNLAKFCRNETCGACSALARCHSRGSPNWGNIADPSELGDCDDSGRGGALLGCLFTRFGRNTDIASYLNRAVFCVGAPFADMHSTGLDVLLERVRQVRNTLAHSDSGRIEEEAGRDFQSRIEDALESLAGIGVTGAAEALEQCRTKLWKAELPTTETQLAVETAMESLREDLRRERRLREERRRELLEVKRMVARLIMQEDDRSPTGEGHEVSRSPAASGGAGGAASSHTEFAATTGGAATESSSSTIDDE